MEGLQNRGPRQVFSPQMPGLQKARPVARKLYRGAALLR